MEHTHFDDLECQPLETDSEPEDEDLYGDYDWDRNEDYEDCMPSLLRIVDHLATTEQYYEQARCRRKHYASLRIGMPKLVLDWGILPF